MTVNKYPCDPWHKELIWVHTRRGFVCILLINIAAFSLFNFHKSVIKIIYHDLLGFERIPPNRTEFMDSSQMENCTNVGGENCKNATTTLLHSIDHYEVLEFRARVYDFVVYSLFMTVSLWLLATVYRTSYERTYFNALLQNSFLSYDLMETMSENRSEYLQSNPRPSAIIHRVTREEYGLHTFLREYLVFGKARKFDELKMSLEDFMLQPTPPTGSSPYFLFIHVIEWIHDLLKAVKMMHKKNVYYLDLQPKNIFLHWLQSTMKTNFQAWLEEGSSCRCGKLLIKYATDPDKYEYSDKRRIVLAKFDHAIRCENGEVQASAVGVPEYYKPPECFNLEIVNAAKVDAWCIGVIAYELLTGGMLTVRASRNPPNTPCEEIINETINKEYISTAMHAHHHLLHCFLDIRFIQKTFKNYDLDQTVFTTDCWTFLHGLLKSSPEERLSIQQALRHPLMKRVRKQTGKIYYINYPL